ncbi:MAG: phosphonate ABC transporter substrate-binding protein [Phycisphaerae bacterium]|nr:phosphonate ABC transporter substrate-binding protein [Phycisphaerae bacterium]
MRFNGHAVLFLACIPFIVSCDGPTSTPPVASSQGDPATGKADDPTSRLELKFGVYSTDTPTDVQKQFQDVIKIVEQKASDRLNRPVKVRIEIAPDYDGGIADLSEGRVDFARFGPASYVICSRQAPDVRILAMETKKGKKRFNGVICIHKDSDIEDVSQLKGMKFAFGDDKSTIGRYLSQNYLAENGVTADDLESWEYLGRHDTVGLAVAAGDFHAGALKESTFKKLVEAGEPIKALVMFPNVTKPWIAREGLDDETFMAIKSALLAVDDPAALKALKFDQFADGGSEDYAFIREAIDNNDVFFAEVDQPTGSG